MLSGPALDRLVDSPIKELALLNTIPISEKALATGKIKVLDVSPMFAEAIQRTYDESSLSVMF